MAQMRLVFNSEGFRQILTSEGCRDLVQGTTEEIRDKAVANYEAVSSGSLARALNPNANAADGIRASTQIGGYGGGRWLGFVSTADGYAAAAEAEDKILTRAAT